MVSSLIQDLRFNGQSGRGGGGGEAFRVAVGGA